MAVWRKPSAHITKVNWKGVFDRSLMRGSVGCVIRNNRGWWIKGVAGMIGLAVPVGAELWSIFYGLKLAWEKGVKHVVVECDCEEAMNAVHNPDPDFWFAEMVDLIKNLEGEAWESCVIQHVSADENRAATMLTQSQLHGDGGVIELAAAPSFLQSILAAERE